jgi:hypothetical protein
MLFSLRITLLSPLLAALLACGSSGTSNISVAGTATSGDYVIVVAPGTAQASIFTGALTVAGTAVTGIFRYNNPGTICVSGAQDIPFTGSIVNGTLTLTSASFASSVATLTLPLPFTATTSGQQVTTGTAVIAGGTCALASTTAKGQYIPSLSGTYSGSLAGPVSGTVSVTLNESSANSDGQFPTTVALTFTSIANSGCDFTIPISAPASGVLSGGALQVSTPTVSLSLNASLPPTAINVAYTANGASAVACSGSYSGNLSN